MLFSNVKEEEFELSNEFVKNGIIYKEVRLKNRGCRCLKCGTFHTNVKEYKLKKITHSIYAHQKCIVLYKQRRFICPKCKSTQMEDNPFKSDINRVSDKTIENILTDLKRYNNTFTAVGERNHVTTRGVIKIFDRYCQMDRLPLPKVLCVDELYFSRKRKKKYVLILINFFNRAIIDILKDRDKHTFGSYLRSIPVKERDKVEYVAIDMNDSYRDVLKIYLHKAILIVDSFHVVKRVGVAFDDIRKKVMRRFDKDKKSDQYYLLKYRDELLYLKDVSNEYRYNHHFHFQMSDYELLTQMLNIDPELKKAYNLYHIYLNFNNTDYDDLNKCRNDLLEIINDYKISGIDEFYSLAETLDNWKDEIVASFSKVKGKRVSNGPIEGRNSLAKKILRLANGYHNFKRFRNRIMYSLNKMAKHKFIRK